MCVDHRLLHRVQRPVGIGEMLDRHHMAAVKRPQEADAGIDRFIDQLVAGQPADEHRTGAAIALGAAFFAAAQPLVQPEIVEQRLGGRKGRKLDRRVIEDEAERRPDLRHQLPR